jgi:hypothetical protein
VKHIAVYTCSKPARISVELIPTRWWLVDRFLHGLHLISNCWLCNRGLVWSLEHRSLNAKSRTRFEVPTDIESINQFREFMGWEPSWSLDDENDTAEDEVSGS